MASEGAPASQFTSLRARGVKTSGVKTIAGLSLTLPLRLRLPLPLPLRLPLHLPLPLPLSPLLPLPLAPNGYHNPSSSPTP